MIQLFALLLDHLDLQVNCLCIVFVFNGSLIFLIGLPWALHSLFICWNGFSLDGVFYAAVPNLWATCLQGRCPLWEATP